MWAAADIHAREPEARDHSASPRAAAFAFNLALSPGINIDDAFEPDAASACGNTGSPAVFRDIRRAGFKSVRLPVRWYAHAQDAPPWRLAPAFLRRVEQVIAHALAQDLAVIINVHADALIQADPQAGLARLKALWRQIALRFSGQPDRLAFELLNEPHGKLTPEKWNVIAAQLLAVVRESNPARMVMVGAAEWNATQRLPDLVLPEEDANLIATIHYYAPFAFTHQGASWIEGGEGWLGTTWPQGAEQAAAPDAAMAAAARWSVERDRPVNLGEFGAYRKADPASRVRWTAAVARAASERGISTLLWEHGRGFGLYDCASGQWDAPLLEAATR